MLLSVYVKFSATNFVEGRHFDAVGHPPAYFQAAAATLVNRSTPHFKAIPRQLLDTRALRHTLHTGASCRLQLRGTTAYRVSEQQALYPHVMRVVPPVIT